MNIYTLMFIKSVFHHSEITSQNCLITSKYPCTKNFMVKCSELAKIEGGLGGLRGPPPCDKPSI